MKNAYEAVEAAIGQADASRKRVSKIRSKQVRGVDDIASLKATAQTWFHTHRPVLAATPQLDIAEVDACFHRILDATAKLAAKATYATALKDAKAALIALRGPVMVLPSGDGATSPDDSVPDFSPLAGNIKMRNILARRWQECAICVKANAHLAAIVMMGGLLEALFVARANIMADKKSLISAKSAPTDKAGKAVKYQDWMLDSYIKVGRELKWITESGKDVADKLKEYRNFIHPAKELRYDVELGLNDSEIFWGVTKALTRQLLASVKP